jgi:hypothetical protein
MIPHFIDNPLIDFGEIVNLTRRPHFIPPQEDPLWLIFFVRVWVKPRAIVRLEGLLKLGEKKHSDLIGNETRGLPTYSIVPQPTMILCIPNQH